MWIWMLGSFIVGGWIGMIVCALMVAGRDK